MKPTINSRGGFGVFSLCCYQKQMGENSRTYYAMSSAPGRSATSTIRISGDRSLDSLSKLTKINSNNFIHGKTFVCHIYNKTNNLIDESVVVYYRSPNSYTGEDVVEIHTHGNPLVVQAVFDELDSFGLNIAEPGEFTRNAYLNNKIDLIQAEAVFSLINAQSNRGVELSLTNTAGKLSTHIKTLRTSLINALSYLEYELDISELDNHTKTIKMVSKEIKKNKKIVKKLIRSYSASKLLQEGIRIAIIGPPNVGKSTLFNALLGHDRAIISDRPGTTRDFIDGTIQIANYSIILVDTAGLRKTKKTIEKEGINKTKLEVESADLIYQILDPTTKKTTEILSTSVPTITIYNKLDLLSKQQKRALIKTNKQALLLSAKFGTGIDTLRQKTANIIKSSTIQKESIYLTTKRQHTILLKVLRALKSASNTATQNELDLISIHLKEAIEQFDWLVGKTTPDDILTTDI